MVYLDFDDFKEVLSLIRSIAFTVFFVGACGFGLYALYNYVVN